jgi:hypothetical protein
MAEEKILNTRIRLKYDSYANWTEKNPTLLSGEIAIARLTTVAAVKPEGNDEQAPVLFKVGPGEFNSLPWVSGLAADVYSWAKKTEKEFVAWVNEQIKHPTIKWEDIDGIPTITDTVTTITAGEHMGEITDNGTDGNHAYVINGKDWTDDIADIEVFSTDIVTVNALGGIAANTDLNGWTTRQILNKLLFPYVDATVSGATATPNGGTYERGETKTITQVKITVTKKSEPITSVALYNGSTLIEEKTGDAVKNGGTFTFTNVNVSVPGEGNKLTVKVTYPDATGNAKTVSKETTALTFVYPYYKGVCAEGATIDEALVKGLTKVVEGKSNKTNWAYTCANQCMVFAYPKAHGLLTKIIDPNNFDITGSFAKHEVSITGLDGTAQAYYVYVNGASTVTNFQVDFNY